MGSINYNCDYIYVIILVRKLWKNFIEVVDKWKGYNEEYILYFFH